MGVSWESLAEVVTTEPEKVKELILQIADENETAGVYDIEIKGNSIFFHSYGYGFYGVKSEDHDDYALLFARLFEEYTGALICFEAVSSCQEQGYYLSSTWIKPDGVVKSKINSEHDDDDQSDEYSYPDLQSDDNETDEYSYQDIQSSVSNRRRRRRSSDDIPQRTQTKNTSNLVAERKDEEDDEDYENFYIITSEISLEYDWSISVDDLEKYQDEMPNLYAAYLKANVDEFNDWEISSGDQQKVITYEVAKKIGELYSDSIFGSDVTEDCHNNIWKLISSPGDVDGYSELFELPENFPKLSKLQ